MRGFASPATAPADEQRFIQGESPRDNGVLQIW